ncbi:hypothetical protein M529_21460 [Sphingobium ummariense RL-3]|uniref:Uncharacterized protein n=1 Tax=Sphingobium ummariense RL-3 TaxID=1346791 RepID=T0J054_9SPHN|nr:hypothetical protein M529_21460 [Sphingobium ummariense RL-3]
MSIFHRWRPLASHDDKFADISNAWKKVFIVKTFCKDCKWALAFIF